MGARVAAVVDLGFGDAGKGTIVDFLTRRSSARAVVRFNGGAQAGHNVVTDDGRHHTFAQLGAGTFVPGVATHLARTVVVHPTALVVEARRIAEVGVGDALDRVTIAEGALVTTPVHQAAARVRELARGDGRFGSCGVGVGETVGDALAAPDDAIRARDLGDAASLRRRVARLRERKRAELAAELRAVAGMEEADLELRALESDDVVDAWIDAARPVRRLVVGDAHLASLLRASGDVVFEGAQGVLLDEWRGFHPYTTWSTCTFDNALALVRELGDDNEVTRVGVLRTYATRHGPGPFPTETPALAHLPEPHNVHGPWQGAFRFGWLDLVLARYALDACGGADALALTHVDALARLGEWRVCRAYDGARDERFFVGANGRADRLRLGPARDLDYVARLGHALRGVAPICESVALGRDEHEARDGCARFVEEALGVRVAVTSSGPTAAAKLARRARTRASR